MDVWEVRKQCCMAIKHALVIFSPSVGDLGGVTGVDGHRSGKLDKRGLSM